MRALTNEFRIVCTKHIYIELARDSQINSVSSVAQCPEAASVITALGETQPIITAMQFQTQRI